MCKHVERPQSSLSPARADQPDRFLHPNCPPTPHHDHGLPSPLLSSPATASDHPHPHPPTHPPADAWIPSLALPCPRPNPVAAATAIAAAAGGRAVGAEMKEVVLHVYDVTNSDSEKTNNTILQINRIFKDRIGLGGIFHSAVQVVGLAPLSPFPRQSLRSQGPTLACRFSRSLNLTPFLEPLNAGLWRGRVVVRVLRVRQRRV
jgi:hypothetical protein